MMSIHSPSLALKLSFASIFRFCSIGSSSSLPAVLDRLADERQGDAQEQGDQEQRHLGDQVVTRMLVIRHARFSPGQTRFSRRRSFSLRMTAADSMRPIFSVSSR